MRKRLCSYPAVLCCLTSALVTIAGSPVSGQIVINELVVNQRNYAGNIFPDTREFIELYNAGTQPVNLQDWTLRNWDLASGTQGFVDTLPNHVLNPGSFFVMGHADVPGVDMILGGGDLWADDVAQVLELRDNTMATIDAVAFETHRTGVANATAQQQAQIGNGYQGRIFSFDNASPNVIHSWGRYLDGVDTDRNGLDFGHLPLTPGASNNLPIADVYRLPNVDQRAVGSDVTEFFASFIMPQVIDPQQVSTFNPRQIPRSPQGGNAIVAWDPAGGGNTIYSKELVSNFDIYAFIDTTPLNVPLTGQQYEQWVYGIGTSDGRFAIADPLNNISGQSNTENASSGLGWFYERYQNGATISTKLLLVDFGEGGNSDPSSTDWKIIQTIDVTGMAADWYRLGIDYDPETGDVVARFGDTTYEFETVTDMLGTFYVGWRETVTPQGPHLARLNVPIFDFVPETGDYNGDGLVDTNDYLKWKADYGTTVAAAGSGADGNGDGIVDAADYLVWRNNFSSSDPLLAAGPTTVPEPSTIAVALLAGLAGWGLRRVYTSDARRASV